MKNKLLILACTSALLLTFSVMTRAQKCTEPGSIRRVTKARAGSYETVTFEVNATTADYNVESAHPPFGNGDGDKIYVKGKFFKEIQFKGVAWTCKIAENLSAPTTQIMGVKNTEQFEGYVSYAVGYRTRSKYVGITKTTSGGKTKVVMKFRR